MDFPSDVDALIIGTSMIETMVASSLSIVGGSVLLLERNSHYGGILSSLNYPSIASYIKLTEVTESDPTIVENSIISQPILPHDIVDFTEKWFIDDRNPSNHSESMNSSTLWIDSLSTPVVINALPTMDSNETSHENTEVISNISSEGSVQNAVDLAHEEFSSSLDFANNRSGGSLLRIIPVSKSCVLQRLRRFEMDILPKLLLCESPNMEATLRSDIARYITFRFINSLLAYFPASQTSESAINQSGTGIIEVPLCRKDIFTSKILNLRQKRTLGSFLEWCFTLVPDQDPIYISFKDRPLKELLSEKFNQDEFTLKIVISNIIMSPMDVKVHEAVTKLKGLLLSMNKFGPFPLIMPMYGAADFPMAYARLAAVFAATTCLNCGYEEISPNHEGTGRRYQVKLTNGHTVNTDFVVLGVDHIKRPLKDPYLKNWMVRAIFIAIGTLSTEHRKSHQTSLLPFPDLKHPGLSKDFIPFIIQTPLEPDLTKKLDLIACNACALADRRIDSLSDCFELMVKSLFVESDGNGDSKKPRLFYASYFQFPIFNEVPVDVLHDKPGFDHVYVAPSPDSTLTLDSCIPQAEKIFRSIFEVKFAGSDIKSERADEDVKNGPFTSLHGIWDGNFPPRPPKPEQLYEEMISVDFNEIHVNPELRD